MIVVSNASPLIILAKLGLFDLPHQLFTSITIPQEVWNEIVVQGAKLPGSTETEEANQLGWLHIAEVANVPQLTLWKDRYALGAGELATILLAKELLADIALIDEQRARSLARSEGVPVLGTVGLLELGYRRGVVADLRQVYQEMLQQGARIDQRILNQSLAAFHLPQL